MKRVLIIGGLDQSGIAGLGADMRSLGSLGMGCAPVATSIVLESSAKLDRIVPIEPDVIRDGIRAVLEDGEPNAVKLGMLYAKATTKTVSKELEDLECPIIVDPVLAASVGNPLAEEGMVQSLFDNILPIADLVTPNLRELQALSGNKAVTYSDAERAADKLLTEGGAGAVLVKGGHMKGKLAADILVEPRLVTEFAAPRLPLSHPRGLGCTYASLITGYIALGEELKDAVGHAKDRLHTSLEHAERLGSATVLNPIRSVVREAELYRITEQMRAAIPELLGILVPDLVPEVGVNAAYAIWGAKDMREVCTLDSRIILKGGIPSTMGSPAFGVSRHIARVVLTAMEYEPWARCAINVRYSESAVKAARRAKLSMSSFDRRDEPKNKRTMAWGTARAIESAGYIPDIIWDAGGHGKEAMMRVLGRNPADVLNKVERLASTMRRPRRPS
ncbi:MAG: bifunctional hydroxymethylpyrimidine kinase/phosphomethylpyrimidine kinase [Euryarchaeota archaeon]|nr:bifunctional hydroxymethylpyrimidine kinase/phosphomethylpyrimidine kinase [Euryarchaeota archaeon]